MDKLDPDDPRPSYMQLADSLRAAIRAEELKPGDKLPSHAHVGTEFGLSIGTVKRAYAALQDDGYIVNRQGRGAFVRSDLPDPALDDPAAAEDIRADLVALTERVGQLEARLESLERPGG